jgi:hypothetical protein
VVLVVLKGNDAFVFKDQAVQEELDHLTHADECIMFIQNSGKHTSSDTSSHPRRLVLSMMKFVWRKF